MGLELLTQADYVLNACGRPVPPKGFRFVDLPKFISFHQQFQLPAWNMPPAPDSGNGDFTVQSLSSTFVQFTVTNNIALPLQVTVTGFSIVLNLPDMTTTVATVVALLNGTPAFAALALAKVVGNGALFAQNPTSVVPFLVPPEATQPRIENLSQTLFLTRGIMLQSDPMSVRLKWPSGRYWNQFRSNNPTATFQAGSNFPQGTGGNLYALDEEMPIERGGRVAVEISGGNMGPVDIALWGVLRYLLKDTGNSLGAIDGQTCVVGYPVQAQAETAPNCLIGYPAPGAAKGKQGSILITDPAIELKERPRVICWPNGNILAPEFRLGNQPGRYVPKGFYDESFTFLSDTYTVQPGVQSYSNAVGVPGQDDVVLRRWRAIVTWADGASGVPAVGMRSPSGYSVTGGDLVPIDLGYWYPFFPTLILRHGTVLVIDVALPNNAVGSVNVQIEFDAAKRRKLAA
jgi:hypothetical protein